MDEGEPQVTEPRVSARRGVSERTEGTRAAKAKRPYARTRRRREEIVKAASQIFATRGYRGSSLVEIADAVGMTHAGVLHHFGSKDQLLIEVLADRDQSDVDQFEGHHAPAGREFLRHLVQTARRNTTRPGIVQAYTALSGESVTEDHPARPWFEARYDGLRDMVREALVETLHDRELPPAAELDAATVAIIGAMDGLQLQWLLNPDVIDMPLAVSLVIESILGRWGVEPGGEASGSPSPGPTGRSH